VITIAEINELKTYYKNDLYANTRKEQSTDQTYRDDTFPVPEIKEPHRILRSGLGSRMVDAPAEQIITSNPQAAFKMVDGDQRAEIRLSEEVNAWIHLMKRQNPNPFKEFVKNLLGRGQAFWQVAHNETWVSGERKKVGLPVLFLVPDSMTIYSSPEEDDCGWIPNCGIPNKIFIICERQSKDVILRYPSWSDPQGKLDKKETVEWMVYIDKDVRYIEVDGEPLYKDGIIPNLYRFVPFVRQYSGFGRRSPDGALESLIVSDLRMSRDLLREECAIRSDIASIMHLFAHKKVDLIIPAGSEVHEGELKENYDMGPGAFNVLTLPLGSELKPGVEMLPTPEAFNHLYNIRAELDKRNPFIMAGFPYGSSGRQLDMAHIAAMRRYDTIIENTETSLATAIEMALQITDRIPTLRPEHLHKADLKAKFECTVALKEPSPVERDRMVTLGDRLWNRGNGSIDLRTNLVEFQGRTQEQAESIIADILVDRLTLYNPDVAEIMGMIFAEEAGMQHWLDEARKKKAGMGGALGGLESPPTQSESLRRQGEIETPAGEEMSELSLESKGGRHPPERYSWGT